jgi:hypothetical protein
MSTDLQTARPALGARAQPRPRAAEHDHHLIRDAIREASVRGTIAVGLAAVAVIHAVDSVGKWSEVRYLFWMYMALIVASLATAAAVLFSRSRAAFLAAAGLCAAVIAGYVLNRTVGLPQAHDDIGNWTEPLGLASLVVEGSVLVLALAAFARR